MSTVRLVLTAKMKRKSGKSNRIMNMSYTFLTDLREGEDNCQSNRVSWVNLKSTNVKRRNLVGTGQIKDTDLNKVPNLINQNNLFIY